MADKGPAWELVDTFSVVGLAIAAVSAGSIGVVLVSWDPSAAGQGATIAVSSAGLLAGSAMYFQGKRTAKRLAPASTAATIEQMTSLSAELGNLAGDVAGQIEDQRKAIQELEKQSQEYERLAAINHDSAEAVRALVGRELKAGERRTRLLSWVQVGVGFALGIVGTLIVQTFWPAH